MAVLDGRTPDMVPIVPVVDGFFAPKVLDRANDECFLDGDCMAAALAAALERFGYDGAVAEMGLGPNPNVLGCALEVAGNDVPIVVETGIGGRNDLNRIAIPDPGADGKLGPVEKLVAAVGGGHAVFGYVRSPFEYAATVRGFMEFMGDFYRDPEFVHELISRVMPATVSVGRALAAAGVDALVLKDSLASTSVISPEHYREFARPYEVMVIEELKGVVKVILHVCRNSAPILADMAATGADVLEIDSPVDLAAARKAVGDRVVLKGNIDAVAVIEKGTTADVREAVKKAMDAARADGGFILSTGDSIPPAAPDENVAALVEAGREYGGY